MNGDEIKTRWGENDMLKQADTIQEMVTLNLRIELISLDFPEHSDTYPQNRS